MSKFPLMTTNSRLRVTPAVDIADDDPRKKIDWHDYTQIALDEQRTGITVTITVSVVIVIVSVITH